MKTVKPLIQFVFERYVCTSHDKVTITYWVSPKLSQITTNIPSFAISFRGSAMCFAFGQTGAGKSYTLLGTPSVPGLYQHAAHDIFEELKSRENTNLWVSYYEIYNNQLYDLLNRRKRYNGLSQ